MNLKKADLLLFAVPVIIFLVSIFFMIPKNGPSITKITKDGQIIAEFDLQKTKNQILDYHLTYHNLIEIKDGTIGFVSADCPDKTCVRTGFIEKAGQVSACVPSKTIIEIYEKE